LEGLNYVAAHSNEIEVANLSFGRIGYSFAFDSIINDLVQRGVVVVTGAGNYNIDARFFTPASTPAAITVSAITDTDGKCGGVGPGMLWAGVISPDDFMWSSSNFGPRIDLAAPSTKILTTNKAGGYSLIDFGGVSLAAPDVAGAAALIKSIHPQSTPTYISDFLKQVGTQAPPAPKSSGSM
jgi:subtilisin